MLFLADLRCVYSVYCKINVSNIVIACCPQVMDCAVLDFKFSKNSIDQSCFLTWYFDEVPL